MKQQLLQKVNGIFSGKKITRYRSHTITKSLE